MYYIEQKYGNDGFATWIKLLRQLAVTDYHYLNLSAKPQVMFLSAKCKVSEETLLLIIQDLCDMGEFEAFLWQENRIIFSTKFVAHVQDAYAKRNNKCIDLPGLLLLLEGLGVRKPHNELDKLPLKGPVNTQSKEEYSKEEETKGKKSKETTAVAVPFVGEVLEAWNEWVTFRKEKKAPLTPTSIKKQIQFLGGRGDPEIIAILNQSMTNGYTGLFELKNDNYVNGSTKKSTQQAIAPSYERTEGFGKL